MKFIFRCTMACGISLILINILYIINTYLGCYCIEIRPVNPHSLVDKQSCVDGGWVESIECAMRG